MCLPLRGEDLRSLIPSSSLSITLCLLLGYIDSCFSTSPPVTMTGVKRLPPEGKRGLFDLLGTLVDSRRTARTPSLLDRSVSRAARECGIVGTRRGGGRGVPPTSNGLGVTTAATLWFVTVIGLCLGGRQIGLGIAAFALGMLVISGLRWVDRSMNQEQHGTLY